MGVGQGLRAVIGTAEESTYGTPVDADRRYEFTQESLVREQSILESQGISGREITIRRGARRVISNRMGTGDITMELAKRGMGRWFEHMLGGTSTISQQAATAAWLQTHQLGTLLGKSLTLQKAIRDGAGTLVDAFSYHGCKVTEWEFTLEVDSIPSLRVALDAEDVESGITPTALLALDEPAGGVFTFKDGALTIDGSPAARVLAATITGSNSLKTDSFFIGSDGLKAEPEVNDFRTISGQFRIEYLSTDYYDLFVSDDAVDAQLELTGDDIESGNFEECNFNVPSLHLTGGAPAVGGPGVVEQTVPFTVSYDDTDNPLTIEYMSEDDTI